MTPCWNVRICTYISHKIVFFKASWASSLPSSNYFCLNFLSRFFLNLCLQPFFDLLPCLLCYFKLEGPGRTWKDLEGPRRTKKDQEVLKRRQRNPWCYSLISQEKQVQLLNSLPSLTLSVANATHTNFTIKFGAYGCFVNWNKSFKRNTVSWFTKRCFSLFGRKILDSRYTFVIKIMVETCSTKWIAWSLSRKQHIKLLNGHKKIAENFFH